MFKSPTETKKFWLRYISAFVITAFALIAQSWLHPLVKEITFLLFYPAIFFSSWVGGLGPGVFSTLLSTLLVLYYFIPPMGLSFQGTGYLIRLVIFLSMGLLFSLFNEILRKRNQKLLQSEKEYRDFFNLAGTGVEQVDPVSKRYLKVNEKLCQITGYTEEELLQKTFMEITHVGDRARELKLYENLLTGKETSWSIEKRYQRKDGENIWVCVTGTIVRNQKEIPIYSIATVQDIDEQKKSKEELTYQRNILKAVTDNMTSALLMMDEKGHPTFLNPAGEKITGFKLEEIKGKPTHYSIHDKKPDGSFYPMEECPIDNGQAKLTALQNQEEIFVHKDGHLYPVNFSVAPLERDKRPIGAVIEFRDITTEKEIHKRLEEREAESRRLAIERKRLLQISEFERRRFETAMSQIPASVIIGEAPDGKFIFSNSKVEEVWGHPLIPTKHIDEYHKWQGLHLDGTPYKSEEWPLARSITKGEIVQNEDCIVPQINGSQKIIRLSSSPVRDAEGNIIAGVVISQDITELVDAIKIRDEFLIIASHELKTPITSLKLNLQMTHRRSLKEPDSLPDYIKTSLASSMNQVDRLVRLIEDLLDVSRMSSGKLEVHCEEFNLVELIEDVIDNHRENFQDIGPTITFSCDKRIIACVDRSRFEQVINNILSNAAKYGGGKPIEVSLLECGNEVHILVKDSGIGIGKEFHDKIFQRFERAISAKYISGLGVGLYISREIISAHKGKILVQSEAGKGTTFTIILPLVR